MRCKNCGSENDDNLYICQNCGSPLYDEDDIPQENSADSTRVFKTVDVPDVNYSESVNRSNVQSNKKEDEKTKQAIIIIAVLAIILITIIVGTIIAVVHNNKNEKDPSVTHSSQASESSDNDYNNDNDFIPQQSTSEKTTKETTAKQTTSESTTKETTTKLKTFNVSLSCNNGGEVEGDGTYKRGDNVTVIARPDDGYDFDGWYKGDKKVSSNTKYTFTVTDNTNLQAVFVIVNEEPIENLEGGED